MTGQNVYDDPEFIAGYVTLDRQTRGLDGAAEWPVLRALLPDVSGRRVVDLGCGFGWFSRWAHQQGATSVAGFDLSRTMLERARSDTKASEVTYKQADLDELVLPAASADLVFSSLTLHYVLDLPRLMSTVASALVPGGSVVFSVEHPIYSAPTNQEFIDTASGPVWPLDNYLVEGKRVRSWFVDGVEKQHRTVGTYVNVLTGAGFNLDRVVEWGPSPEQIETKPELARDLHRPWFLLVSATLGDENADARVEHSYTSATASTPKAT